MSKLVRSHRDDMAQAQQAWKTERRALEALLCELRETHEHMQNELRDTIKAERFLKQQVELKAMKEIEKLRGRLQVFCPDPYSTNTKKYHAGTFAGAAGERP